MKPITNIRHWGRRCPVVQIGEGDVWGKKITWIDFRFGNKIIRKSFPGHVGKFYATDARLEDRC